MSERNRKGYGIALGLLTVLAMAYVLSYAPFVRWRSGGFPYVTSMPGYRPVEWLMDSTPAKAPLMWWCDMWGVAQVVEYNSLLRENPSPQYEALPIGREAGSPPGGELAPFEAVEVIDNSPPGIERPDAEYGKPPTPVE